MSCGGPASEPDLQTSLPTMYAQLLQLQMQMHGTDQIQQGMDPQQQQRRRWRQQISPQTTTVHSQFTSDSTPPSPASSFGHNVDETSMPPGLPPAVRTLAGSISPPAPALPLSSAQQVAGEGTISISIDFGTAFSSVAYGSSRIAGGRVQQILTWPGSLECFRQVPTCLLYDEVGRVIAWGLEAKFASPMAGASKCEGFKLFLEPDAIGDESTVDPRLPDIPPGKRPIDLIIDFLTCLGEYAKDQINRDIGAVIDLNTAEVCLTVPAAWDPRGREIMREAAIVAGLVMSNRAGDHAWRDRLTIVTESEAAVVHCVHLMDLHHLMPSQNFIVCDAGAVTVDFAVYKIVGKIAHLEIADMCAPSGANCGSLFLDLRFRELVKTLLADHPVHLDPASLAYFVNSFSETDKLNFSGVEDDDNMFDFTCFNVEDPHDPSVGLINGQLSLPGNLLRREVFDPVVDQVIQLLEEQLAKVDQPIHALLLVGGFAGSEYLKQRVEQQFSSRIPFIARPPDAANATLLGAAQYGLVKRTLFSAAVCSNSNINITESSPTTPLSSVPPEPPVSLLNNGPNAGESASVGTAVNLTPEQEDSLTTLTMSSVEGQRNDSEINYTLSGLATSIKTGWQLTGQNGAVISTLLAGIAAQLIGFFKDPDNYTHAPEARRRAVVASCYYAIFFNIGAAIASFVMMDYLGEVPHRAAESADGSGTTGVPRVGRLEVSVHDLLSRPTVLLLHWLLCLVLGTLTLLAAILLEEVVWMKMTIFIAAIYISLSPVVLLTYLRAERRRR